MYDYYDIYINYGQKEHNFYTPWICIAKSINN